MGVLRKTIGAGLLALAASGGARAEIMLGVEQLSGDISVDHLGEVRELHAGDALAERDVLRLGRDARLGLRFGDSLLELGPGTALAIEKLPTAAGAADLRSIFSLWQGYLRVVWAPPPKPHWPLHLYFGGQRLRLFPGEYFFERRGEMTRSCVASGALTMTAIVGSAAETLRPSACYRITAGAPPQATPRSEQTWLAVRESYALDAVATAHPHAETTLAANTTAAIPAEVEAPAATTPPAAAKPPIAPNAAALPAAHEPASAATVTVTTNGTSPALAAPSADTGADPGWTVIVGSFTDPQNADQLQRKLIAAGYVPFLRTKIIDGHTWNSVQLRGFATRAAAQAKLGELQSKFGYENLRLVQLH